MLATWQCYRTKPTTPPARRAAGALALGSYLLAIVGLPVWQPVEITAERFACQSRRCGCRTAAQCWTSCCCFTLEQRIAWAKANNAEIPAHVLARAKSTAGASPAANAKPSACGHCCAHKSAKPAAKKVEPPRSGRIVWVDSVQAQKCRGETNGWMTLSVPVFPPPPRVAIELELLPRGEVLLADVHAPTRNDLPDARPG